MAHQMLKPYSFLLYFLAIIFFFFVGLSFAGWMEAGKNQGLAGGAIVFGYGVLGAIIGLLVALFVARSISRKLIIRFNIVLALCILAFYAFYHIRFLERQKERKQENERMEQPKEPTASSYTLAIIGGIEVNNITVAFLKIYT